LQELYVKVIVQYWKIFPSQQLNAIRRFQAIEADGVWHLYSALHMTTDPQKRAMLFQHIIEEDSHAENFSDVFSDYSEVPFQQQHFERVPLIRGESELWKIISYIHVGEVDATKKFTLLEKNLPNGSLRSTLNKICRDEAGHIHLTAHLAKKFEIDTNKIQMQVRAFRRARFLESLSQLVLRLANQMGLIFLVLGYWIFGGIGFIQARRKLEKRFVEYNNNHLKRFD
jgi:rubrerythrin